VFSWESSANLLNERLLVIPPSQERRKYLSPVAKRHLFSGSRALVFPSIPRALRNLLLLTLHLPP